MKYLIILLALLVTPALAAQTKSAKSAVTSADKSDAGSFTEIKWDELVPRDWNPAKKFKNIDLSKLSDFDPKAIKILAMIQQEWDNAPIDPKLDGKKVKIPGFVVPIEEQGHAVTEFLLVPYFGACIHVPPPPANQIIHVITAKPIQNLRMMDTVWVMGEMKATRYSKEMPMGLGNSGYQINSVAVTPYKDPMVSITPMR